MLTTTNVTAAADASNIPRRTLCRWLTEADFRTAYRERSRDSLQESTGRLRAAAGEAVETLRASLQSDSEAIRVRAAIAAMLDAPIKVDVDDLAARVEALEEFQDEFSRDAASCELIHLASS